VFGASMALGAFLAGMVVAQSPVSHQAAADALPLCSGWVVLSEKRTRRIAIRHVESGRVGALHPLDAEPGPLALDAEHRRLFTTLGTQQAFVEIDRPSGAMSVHPMASWPVGLLVGPGGDLYIFSRATSRDYVSRLTPGAAVLEGPWQISSGSPALTPDGEIILGDASSARLRRYALDPAVGVTLQQSRSFSVEGYYPVPPPVVSPDGAHLVYAVAPVTGWDILDLDPLDFLVEGPRWQTLQTYAPVAFAFDPSSSLLASVHSTSVLLFDVATHALRGSRVITPCSAASEGVAFSQGGSLVVARERCGSFPFETGRLHWQRLPLE